MLQVSLCYAVCNPPKPLSHLLRGSGGVNLRCEWNLRRKRFLKKHFFADMTTWLPLSSPSLKNEVHGTKLSNICYLPCTLSTTQNHHHQNTIQDITVLLQTVQTTTNMVLKHHFSRLNNQSKHFYRHNPSIYILVSEAATSSLTHSSF